MVRIPVRVVAVLSVLAVLAVGACSSLLGGKAEVRERSKWILEGRALRLSLPHSERPYELKVQVERFAISRFYDRDQIIYRLDKHEIRDDRYNLWAVRPREMLTNAVADYLRGARLFTDLREDFLDTAPDFTLTGTIDAIERFDSGDRWWGRLDGTIQLIDNATGRIFWVHRFDPNEVEVFEPDMAFTVEGMQEILGRNMAEAIRSLDRHLLIRKASNEGRDLTALLDERNGAAAESTEVDTTQEIPRETDDYVVVPGKLAPVENGR
jgi:ABC-type uncharacterized transport system auxiliary subunit